ncbi:MAG: RluA family pseudouridine synthase [Planctomycetota bacterium]|nr:RluA family pseudouridine synthase [Planctomycetota bacterium]
MKPLFESQSIHVSADSEGKRLDLLLVERLSGVSRSHIQTLIKAGRVMVDEERAARPGQRLKGGEKILVEAPEAEVATTPAGRPIRTLDVLHEDEHLIVIDKPAGLLVHPTDRVAGGTVADLAQDRFGELPEVQGEGRAGIVHRLDRLTSGVMILGRTTEALENLKLQFKERRVQKTYLALCHGEPRFDNEWVRGFIGIDIRRRDRYRVTDEGGGREAATLVEVRERLSGFSYIAAHPKTGRTHQLRVHLAHLGHPIVGDRVYRHPGALPVPVPDDAPTMGRQALHAARLVLTHPESGQEVSFEASMPDDMSSLLEYLRERASD